MIWRTTLIELAEIVALVRKMHVFETSPQIRKAVRFSNVVRQRITNVLRKIAKRRGHDPPELPASDACGLLVNRDVAAYVERVGLFALFDELEFRIEKDDLRI